MITQNHSTKFAAITTLFVALLGCNNSFSGERLHNKINHGHNAHRANHMHKKEHKNSKFKLITKSIKHKLKYVKYKSVGIASWYGFESGNKTAMGTRFNPLKLTAAHRTLPLPSKVRVTNLKNKKSVIVTVNDRGPYKGKRIIDLSLAAARVIDMTGLEKVKVETIH
ncbi:MAG: septal ring lytic transglycosylase RlpA family protein [Nitrososphaeraceae archaeon]